MEQTRLKKIINIAHSQFLRLQWTNDYPSISDQHGTTCIATSLKCLLVSAHFGGPSSRHLPGQNAAEKMEDIMNLSEFPQHSHLKA